MLDPQIEAILDAARPQGWVLEPEALRLLQAAGLAVPRFAWVRSPEAALEASARIGFPLVAKVVSARIMHKSDVGGVTAGIRDPAGLTAAYSRLAGLPGFDGALIAEQLGGHELIVGAKIDFQFGPVILLGIGGTGVEIYKDTVTRMAPLTERDVHSMLGCLRGGRLLTGHRGGAAVSLPKLTALVLGFSGLVMQIAERIDSIDLNPVFCSAQACTVADARILLAKK